MRASVLNSLLQAKLPNTPIEGITLHSNDARPGFIYFAVPGTKTHGASFIPEAIKNGAALVVCEAGAQTTHLLPPDFPIFYEPQLVKKLSAIASLYYGHPSSRLKIIGVTGTNGKTTVSHLIAGALHQLCPPAAQLGTIGNGIFGQLTPSLLTTLDPFNLQKTFLDLLSEQVQYAAIEVSSHALAQFRVDGTQFEVAVFTNLTRDHLDYHGDMERYFEAKSRMFLELNPKYAVINIDCQYGKKLAKLLQPASTVTVSMKEKADLSVTDLAFHEEGTSLQVVYRDQKEYVNLALLGEFNVANFLSALGALLSLKINFKDALSALSTQKAPKGRIETLHTSNSPTVVIDYAHTPDALLNILKSVRLHAQGKVWCIFGCGGDRDKGKRPLMAQVAEEYADVVILTDDNPRTEDSHAIFQDILSGFNRPPYLQVHDRQAAIVHAISHAAASDWVVIAGKGHENYQIIGEKKLAFDDKLAAMQALKSNALKTAQNHDALLKRV